MIVPVTPYRAVTAALPPIGRRPRGGPCAPPTLSDMAHPFASADVDVTPAEVRRRHAAGEIDLIDVRERYERDAGHIALSRHIELRRLAASSQTLPRDRPVVFYCRVGARSRLAAGAFRRAGIDAYSMAGGLQAWDEAGHPLTPDGGRVADH